MTGRGAGFTYDEWSAIMRMARWAHDRKFTALRWELPNDGTWTYDEMEALPVRRDGMPGEVHLMGKPTWREPVASLCRMHRESGGPRVVGLPHLPVTQQDRRRRPVPAYAVPAAVLGAAFILGQGGQLAVTDTPRLVTSQDTELVATVLPPPGPNIDDQWVGSPREDALHAAAADHGLIVQPAPHGLGNATLHDEAEVKAKAEKWVRDNVAPDRDLFDNLAGTADPEEWAQPPGPEASQNARAAFEAGAAAKAEADREAAAEAEDAANEEAPGPEPVVVEETADEASAEDETEFIPLPEPVDEPEPAPVVVPEVPADPAPVPLPVAPPVTSETPSASAERAEVDESPDSAAMPDPADLRSRAEYYRLAAEHLDKAAAAIEAGDAIGPGGQDGSADNIDTDSTPLEDGEAGDAAVDVTLPGVEITVNGETQTVDVTLHAVQVSADAEAA